MQFYTLYQLSYLYLALLFACPVASLRKDECSTKQSYYCSVVYVSLDEGTNCRRLSPLHGTKVKCS